jgi:hypothetical protein
VRYFTPELLAQLGSSDTAIVRAAEAEWDRRQQVYEEELKRIEAELPEHVRAFNDLLLHDARVYSLAREGPRLLLVLHKDIPPRDLVIITYSLAGEPLINKEALPPDARSQVMDFDYDELGIVREGERAVFTQSILFSNGWEVQLRFHDVRFVLADPLFAAAALPEQQSDAA